MNSEPVEHIRVFDPLMRGGTDSRTTRAAFNQEANDWSCVWCLWNMNSHRELKERGQTSQRAFPSQRGEDRHHRWLFLTERVMIEITEGYF